MLLQFSFLKFASANLCIRWSRFGNRGLRLGSFCRLDTSLWCSNINNFTSGLLLCWNMSFLGPSLRRNNLARWLGIQWFLEHRMSGVDSRALGRWNIGFLN